MKKLFILILLFVCVVTIAATRRQFFVGGSPELTDWARRVIANGGPTPSGNSIRCMEILRTNMIALGTNDIYTLCVFVPDSVIAASTPLFKHKGADPWTNSNFAATNLSIEGLKGDGTSKALNTGLLASDNHAYSNDVLVGMSMVISESNSNRSEVNMAARNAPGDQILGLVPSAAGRTEYYSAGTSSGLQFLVTNDFVRVGWISGNTLTNAGVTNQYIYIASPLEPHRIYATEPFSQPVSPDETITVFSARQNGTNVAWSAQRLSAALVHFPFTETKSSNVWWALKTCRECLGGGTGDPVQDWSRRLVELGGAAISANSSNSLRTFYSGLATDRLIEKMIVGNVILPDSVFAARTPFIWQAGAQVWTNLNFGTTNLSVNGLTGNATDKYLQTALTNNSVSTLGFGSANAGISLLMQANPDTAGNGIFAVQGSGSQQFSLFSFAGTGLFRCWLSTLVNQNFVSAPLGTTTNGWISGQRTAANAIALYKARGDTAHTLVTNATGAQTGATFGTHANFVYAVNNAGTAASFSAPTISYVGVETGLTQTQNSNLWFRVATLRTNLGGGNFP